MGRQQCHAIAAQSRAGPTSDLLPHLSLSYISTRVRQTANAHHTFQTLQAKQVTCSDPCLLATRPLQSPFLQIPQNNTVHMPRITSFVPGRPINGPATTTKPLCPVPTHHAFAVLTLDMCEGVTLEWGRHALLPCVCGSCSHTITTALSAHPSLLTDRTILQSTLQQLLLQIQLIVSMVILLRGQFVVVHVHQIRNALGKYKHSFNGSEPVATLHTLRGLNESLLCTSTALKWGPYVWRMSGCLSLPVHCTRSPPCVM
jgi:hypothetical protein